MDPVQSAEDIGPRRSTSGERLLHRGQGDLPHDLDRGVPSRCGLGGAIGGKDGDVTLESCVYCHDRD